MGAPTMRVFGVHICFGALFFSVATASSFTCQNAADSNCLRLGMLMRMTDQNLNGLGDSWQTVTAGALLAVKHFNDRNGTLIPAFGQLGGCSIRINASLVDNTASAPKASVNAYLAGAYQSGQCASNLRWHMLIGAARSACSTPVAMLGALHKVPQVAYWSSSPDLDSEAYPYFSRTIPADTTTTAVLTSFIRSNHWSQVGLMYIKDAWGNGFATTIAKHFTDHGLTLTTSAFNEGDSNSVETAVNQIQSSRMKIIIACTFDHDFMTIMRAAISEGITSSDYHWIYGTAYPWGSITDPAIIEAVQGSTEIEAAGGVTGHRPWDRMKQAWPSLTAAEFNPQLPREAWGQLRSTFFQDTFDGNSIHDVMGYAFDAVATAGLAACASGNHQDPDALMRSLKELDFEGLSGQVRFSEWGSRSADSGNFFIYNIRRASRRVGAGLTSVMASRYVSSTGSFDYRCALCVGDGVMYHDGTFNPPSDTWPTEEVDNTAIVVVSVTLSALLVVGCVVFIWYRRNKIESGREKKALIRSMQEELQSLKDCLVGTVVVTQDYAPGAQIHTSDDQVVVDMVGIVGVPQNASAVWYWQESAGREHLHDASRVLMDGKDHKAIWVSYESGMTNDIEAHWSKWERSQNDHSLRSFSVWINSIEYQIDLGAMTQTRVSTKFVRAMRRVMAPSSYPPNTHITQAIKRKGSTPSLLAGCIPVELQEETQLVVFEGALVQVSKTRDDGWSYGNVVFNPNEKPPRLDNDTYSLDAGWFPAAIGRAPVQKDLEKLNERMGSGAADCLAPPSSWSKVVDPLLAERVPASQLSAQERQAVEAAFRQTVPSSCKIESIERVQNMSMWQSYAVKRQTIMSREKGTAAARLERRWLFHGTTIEVLDKIVQQGFNRSFCGKNATMYGKGVYFARDAKYSANPQYAVADSYGICHMFACRVTVGEYCLGRKDILTPDIRMGNVLFDSTVDSVENPALFVTYHDAQAYPEYIIHFRQS